MDSMPVKFIVLSDIHLYADTNKILLGVNTRHSFQAVLKCIHENEKNIDFILIAGDLTQDCSPAGYLYVADMLKTFSVPVYCIPGNHDDPKIMAQVYPHDTISMHKHIVLKDWHMVLLNTHKHQAVEGYLDESQLNYLRVRMVR
jgi:Icc protein